MVIENDTLKIEQELNDEMLSELNENLSKVNKIEIDTDNITSLSLQKLFCATKEKEIIVNNSFVKKFFENIEFRD